MKKILFALILCLSFQFCQNKPIESIESNNINRQNDQTLFIDIVQLTIDADKYNEPDMFLKADSLLAIIKTNYPESKYYYESKSIIESSRKLMQFDKIREQRALSNH
jgi:GTPase Era involved in 16S rRNA processing